MRNWEKELHDRPIFPKEPTEKRHKKKNTSINDGLANWERTLLNPIKEKPRKQTKRSTKNQSWDGRPKDYENIKKLAGGLYKMIKGKNDLEILKEAELIKAKQIVKIEADKARKYVKEYKHQKKLERREKIKSAIKFIPEKLKQDHPITFANGLNEK